MEDIYLKGFTKRDWCSDKIHLKSYFEKYSNELSTINHKTVQRKTMSEMEMLKLFVPQANLLSEEELLSLQNDCSGAHLTTFNEDDLRKCLSGKDGPTGINKNREECLEVNKEKSSTKEYKKNRIKPEKKNTIERDISWDAAGGSGVRNLNPRVDFKVLFRIHEPYSYIKGDNTPPGRCMQEIAVLGRQPLTQLRDSIICEVDAQDVNGDISENPDAPIEKRARDCYFSNMFYFDNTFYVDKRHEGNLDYSEPIRTWGLTRGIKLGESVSMQSVKVGDLTVRFGYPYLYMHQGCCEHVVYISDASLLTSKDSLHSQDYPLPTKISHLDTVKCMLCLRLPAKWIVTDSEVLINDSTYECTNCFKSYHYINGVKVGKFKAFHYTQRNVLL